MLGISADTVEKQKKFKEKYDLHFPLLTDADRKTHQAYGAWGERPGRGVGVIRSTFVVDEQGKIAVAQYNVKATGHVAKLRRDLSV